VKGLSVLAVLAAALLVAGCGAGTGVSNLPVSPERPGTNIKIANPNPTKWNNPVQQGPRYGNARFYVCKPLACAGTSMVAIQTAQSPTRNPDRTALEKAAKLLPTQAKAQDMMMDAASEGDERQASLSSAVTEARGYPAIIAELKRTTRGKVSYVMRGDLFIGNALVKVFSASTTREAAKRHFDEFVNTLEITDFEPPAPAPGTVQANAPGSANDPQAAFSNMPPVRQ
jgi:hypothetical protein